MQQIESTKSSVIVKAKNKIGLLEKLSFAWTIISVLFSTGFMIFAVATRWGNSKYIYILLGIICAYIFVFVLIIALRNVFAKKKFEVQNFNDKEENSVAQTSGDSNPQQNESILQQVSKNSELQSLQKEGSNQNNNTEKKIDNKRLRQTKKLLNDYKSGLSILKALTNLLYIIMTITVMFSAASMRGVNGIAAWVTIIISLVLAILTLSFKISTIVLKKMLPSIARKGMYTVYEVIDGKVKERARTNKFIANLTKKYKEKK